MSAEITIQKIEKIRRSLGEALLLLAEVEAETLVRLPTTPPAKTAPNMTALRTEYERLAGRIEGKPGEILRELVDSLNGIIPKNELIAIVWPDEECSGVALRSAVHELNVALKKYGLPYVVKTTKGGSVQIS